MATTIVALAVLLGGGTAAQAQARHHTTSQGVFRRVFPHGTTTTVKPTTTTVLPTTTTVPPTTTTIPPTTTTTIPPPPGGSILFNAVEQLGLPGPVTEASAVSLARSSSFLTTTLGRVRSFEPYLAEMRADNPNLKIIVYINGAFAQKSQGSTYPASFYAHDAAGNKIQSNSYGNYLMDVTAGSGWIADRVTTCANVVAQYHVDGCFLDVLGYGGVSPGYVTSLPVHPGTTTPWTPAQWIQATNVLSQAVRAGIGGGWVIANGLDNGTAFAGSGRMPGTANLLPGITGADAELFPNGNWLDNVQMLQTAGSVIQTNTKFNSSDQWHRFTLATFAVGTNGLDSYFFEGHGSDNSDAPDTYQAQAAALGTFTGPMTQLSGGAFGRNYSNGMVVANPTAGSVTVNFAAAMTNLNGLVVTSEVLAPQSGDLLHA